MTEGRLRMFGWGLAIAFTVLLTVVVMHKPPHASSAGNPSWVTPLPSGGEGGTVNASPRSVATQGAASPSPTTQGIPGVPDGGHLAVAVVDRTTGRQVIQNGDERFRTASIVKVDILACLLWQDQRTGKQMTTAQMSEAARMIEVSDNAAADALFALIGKQSGLAEANRAFGLTHTAPGTTTVHPWGQTLTTARDQLRLLDIVSDPGGPLTTASKAYILSLMKRVVSSQRWGISAAAAHGATVYIKDGWLAEQSDNWRWIVNSIGRIVEGGHEFLVVVLSDRGGSQNAGISAVQHAAVAAVSAIRTA